MSKGIDFSACLEYDKYIFCVKLVKQCGRLISKREFYMLYDKDIRDDLCDFLEEKHGKIRFFEELTMGKSRADIVMVTSEGLYGIEIKSDADTYQRLERQVKDYDRFYDYNIVVVGTSHAEHIGEHVPDYWGIITAELVDGKVDLYEYRHPALCPKAKLINQMHFLWKSEMRHIQDKLKLYKYSDKSRAYIRKYLMDKVPHDELKIYLLEELFEREYHL